VLWISTTLLRITQAAELPHLSISFQFTGKPGSFGGKEAAMLVHCPICPSTFAEQVLTHYRVTATKDADSEVGALAIYQCPIGHIFFVRAADLSRASSPIERFHDQQLDRH
jgi:hypothetical protein